MRELVEGKNTIGRTATVLKKPCKATFFYTNNVPKLCTLVNMPRFSNSSMNNCNCRLYCRKVHQVNFKKSEKITVFSANQGQGYNRIQDNMFFTADYRLCCHMDLNRLMTFVKQKYRVFHNVLCDYKHL